MIFPIFSFNAPATTEIYTLSLHDALPIFRQQVAHGADWIKYYSDRRYYFTPDSVLHSWVNFTDDEARAIVDEAHRLGRDRKSTRLNSSHMSISYAVFCLKKKKKNKVEEYQ